jgi:hypothetical protein
MLDTDHLLPALTALLLGLFGLSFATSLGGHLDGVLRVVACFTLAGTFVAYFAERRGNRLGSFTIIARWQGGGLGFAVTFEALEALVSGA